MKTLVGEAKQMLRPPDLRQPLALSLYPIRHQRKGSPGTCWFVVTHDGAPYTQVTRVPAIHVKPLLAACMMTTNPLRRIIEKPQTSTDAGVRVRRLCRMSVRRCSQDSWRLSGSSASSVVTLGGRDLAWAFDSNLRFASSLLTADSEVSGELSSCDQSIPSSVLLANRAVVYQ